MKKTQSGINNTSFSDHSIFFCTRKVTKVIVDCPNTVKLRSLKNYNKDDFQSNLLSADWSSVLLSNILSESWYSFKHIFLCIVSNSAPLKQIEIKQRIEPSINSYFLKIIKDG